jgi:DNA-binding LacI/PurR family transcriptional regulator
MFSPAPFPEDEKSTDSFRGKDRLPDPISALSRDDGAVARYTPLSLSAVRNRLAHIGRTVTHLLHPLGPP